jgi:hypothetical protein
MLCLSPVLIPVLASVALREAVLWVLVYAPLVNYPSLEE